ncbi:external alternative NAD(P)H-ubiquinone oxidoreductase B1, mitochondrial [Panicum miliaceum]|uniref:External alternative NAD(P)H-ubiquinone oxidoreductase B1, mitochondrial n=1 Tax=Panicum miliaceum TaxID=4540 RepID=A0A3L6RWU1_PANMI|nr:external alternative NAD(P)H-ubiquinone oxidoreductase B1, mitochondrial [Panicum miliaceum]
MGFSFFTSRAAARFLDGIGRPGVSTAALLLTAASGGGLVAYADSAAESAPEPSQDAPKKKVLVLGTGWAGTSFLKNLDCSRYEVRVISPRNYFAFTPLLPSVTCGTVEPRSIIEPIRRMFEKKSKDVTFCEAECFKIDASKKIVHCRSAVGTNLDGNGDFMLDYDYLVVALGANVNTFNTPGVLEHCHFLKEVEDAQKIRRSVIDCFEKASLPNISEEEKRKALHFVVIGGGPTGVEFAAELHDFLVEDLVKLYPAIQELVKITIIQSGEHILNMFDKRIAAFAEEKFQRDGIEVATGFRVVRVSDDLISMKSKSVGEEVSVPYGMAVWSAGIGTRPVIMDFMQQIGQTNRRALATNEWLRVRECEGVYAIGDCATVSQRKIMDDISMVFKMADKDNSGTLTLKEINDVLEDICIRYPQVELYMKSMHMLDIADLIKGAIGDSHKESMVVDIEGFKKALSHVDSQVKSAPATAQVAAQQGYYLAECFNKMEKCKEHPEGPLRMTGESGRHFFRPFRYKHLGQFAPLGGEQAAAELPGDWVSMGHSTQWLWYSVYAR